MTKSVIQEAAPPFDIQTQLVAPYQGKNSAVVVCMIESGETHTAGFGDLGVTGNCPPEDLIFEMGSITKVFTGLLFARLTVEGHIDPHRPVSTICKEFSGLPEWITPLRLATHTSGLPRLHVPIWKAALGALSDDPYADFSRDDLIAWMNKWRPSREPSEARHNYSNLGFGLLGEVLALSQATDYEVLLNEKLLQPLGLPDTTMSLNEEQQQRFMQPHSSSGKAVRPWTFKALAAAGALRSTATDLAHFSSKIVEALDHRQSELERAIAETTRPLVGIGTHGNAAPITQCIAWFSMKLDPEEPTMLFHDGGTAGSTCALYICPEKRASIVLLSNRGVAAGTWSNLKLIWANPHRLASRHFADL